MEIRTCLVRRCHHVCLLSGEVGDKMAVPVGFSVSAALSIQPSQVAIYRHAGHDGCGNSHNPRNQDNRQRASKT
jgi:hypothetical protein